MPRRRSVIIIDWKSTTQVTNVKYMSIKKTIKNFLRERFLWRKRKFIVSANFEPNSRIFDLIREYTKGLARAITDYELYHLYLLASKTQKLNGIMAEVGVWAGCSSRVIAKARSDNRRLLLFDTFEGIPSVQPIDSRFYEGQFNNTSLEIVKLTLADCPNVEFVKGVFPDTAGPFRNEKFSFVHLDVDVYESTKNALEFFYPRMVKGGVIVSHDYHISEGVTKAFDDFFRDKAEIVIEIPTVQCVVIKL